MPINSGQHVTVKINRLRHFTVTPHRRAVSVPERPGLALFRIAFLPATAGATFPRPPMLAVSLLVRGCQMKDGHGAITVGSQISGGVRNVFAENCYFDSPNLWMALRFKNNALRGGRLENFYYRNIEVGQVRDAVLTVDFNYEEGEKGPFTPVVRNVVVNNLRCGKSARVLDLQGFKSAPIYDVHLENCAFDNVAQSSVVKNVQGLEFATCASTGSWPITPEIVKPLESWQP